MAVSACTQLKQPLVRSYLPIVQGEYADPFTAPPERGIICAKSVNRPDCKPGKHYEKCKG
jgi:hypothetical protein